jgi:hypothetical protein
MVATFDTLWLGILVRLRHESTFILASTLLAFLLDLDRNGGVDGSRACTSIFPFAYCGQRQFRDDFAQAYFDGGFLT